MGNDYSSSDSSSGKSSSISLLREDVRNKADEKWVQAKLDPLKEDIDETKQIALSARKKANEPHLCTRDKEIDQIMKSINGWRNVKIGGMISLVVIIVGVAAQFFTVKNSVENNRSAITAIQQDIVQVDQGIVQARIEVKEVKTIVEKNEKKEAKQEEKRIEDIKSAIRGVLAENPPNSRRPR